MHTLTKNPYEIRSELLSQAIQLATLHCDANYNLARDTYELASKFALDCLDQNSKALVDAKKELEKATEAYKGIMNEAVTLAEKMNAFVSKDK